MNGWINLFVNTRSQYRIHRSATAMFRDIQRYTRRYFHVILLASVLFVWLLAATSPYESASGLIDDPYGSNDSDGDVIPSPVVPTGGLWDVLWWIRGQPPGMSGGGLPFFTVIGLTGQLNGPTNPAGIFFEGITDLVVYLPLFFDPVFLLLHMDLVPLFFPKFIMSMLLLAGTIGMMILIIVPLLIVLAFFTPLVLVRLFDMLGPLLRLLLAILLIAAVIGLTIM